MVQQAREALHDQPEVKNVGGFRRNSHLTLSKNVTIIIHT